MNRRVVIVGAGIGGLTSAIRLAHRGCQVTIVEARPVPPAGWLPGSNSKGYVLTRVPYVLLDRPGLEWAFTQLNIKPTDHFQLHRIPAVYQLG